MIHAAYLILVIWHIQQLLCHRVVIAQPLVLIGARIVAILVRNMDAQIILGIFAAMAVLVVAIAPHRQLLLQPLLQLLLPPKFLVTEIVGVVLNVLADIAKLMMEQINVVNYLVLGKKIVIA